MTTCLSGLRFKVNGHWVIVLEANDLKLVERRVNSHVAPSRRSMTELFNIIVFNIAMASSILIR